MNFGRLLWLELRALLSNTAVVITVFGGVLFYSVLYPLPYANQTPREQLVSVVNLDKSSASYQLERMIDATPQVKVVQRDHSLEQAKQAFLQGNISGLVVIPEHFYKDLLLGRSPTLAYAGDASYFLVYGTVVEGLGQAGGTLAAQVKVSQLLLDGQPLNQASEQYTSIKLNLKPTFNPRMGYVDYVVPAVFVLILQQTLIMASGLMVGTQKDGIGYWTHTPPLKLYLARIILLVSIYYLLGLFYFGISFTTHGINQLAQTSDLLLLMLPFFVASTVVGLVLGKLLPRRELVTLVVLISSMPLIFTAGFIWPLEVIPQPLLVLSELVPSTAAIQAFLAINQMGAQWWQIAAQWSQLWLVLLGWSVILWLSHLRDVKQQ
ncbi:ABC transporter permease [Vibrio sp.]|uniref:ABC transporter permease n=1 Tax=Vibrio sp. TaxID=678 RepID=UPI003D11A354